MKGSFADSPALISSISARQFSRVASASTFLGMMDPRPKLTWAKGLHGAYKRTTRNLHQYFCRVLEQNRLLVFRRCPVGGVLGGRQLEARTRYAMSEVFETI